MSQQLRMPPGPDAAYDVNRQLLDWMGEQFARFGDTVGATVYELPTIITRDPQHAEHVLRDNWRNYVKGQAVKRVGLLLGNGLMVSEGELWKRQRRMIQPAFHRDSAASVAGIARAANRRLIGRWEEAASRSEEVNVTADVSRMVLDIVIGFIFGGDTERMAPHFRILSENPQRSLEFAQAFRAMGQRVIELVHERRNQPSDGSDLLAALMTARDPVTGNGMGDRQLLNEVMTLVVAGHETTALTLSWIWYLLSQNPAAEETLRREFARETPPDEPAIEDFSRFPYCRQVIEEALRMYPPGWLVTRKALADDHLDDYLVPAGAEVYLPIYFIQRHPALWRDPDAFRPERFGPEESAGRHRSAMLPFSAGPRNCIGEMFARVELQIHVLMVANCLRMRYVAPGPLALEPAVNLRNKFDFIMTPERISFR